MELAGTAGYGHLARPGVSPGPWPWAFIPHCGLQVARLSALPAWWSSAVRLFTQQLASFGHVRVDVPGV